MVDKKAPNINQERIDKKGVQIIQDRWWKSVISFAIPAIFVLGLFVVLLSFRDRAETIMANLATLLPVGYAFGAGMVASVNPCGFFMLPSFISYHLGADDAEYYHSPAGTRILKALLLGGVATTGFVVIIALVGSLISAGGQWIIRVFPYAGLIIGALMVFLGLWLVITGKTLGIMGASRVTVGRERNLRNVFIFGLAYAIGSLSCTLPIFLVVVGSSLANQGLASSISQFISYALGMGTILIAVSIGSALFQNSVAELLRRFIPFVHRASALFLMAAGVYLVYYWLFISGLSFI
jgi:cytochrome c-type biogenesis protein